VSTARRRIWVTALLLATMAPVLLSPAPAAALPDGATRFVECLSGKLAAKRTARVTGGCSLARTAAPDAHGSGLDHLRSLTAGPEGRSLYAVSSRDDSVLAFRTPPLRMRQCFTADRTDRRGRPPCRLFPGAGTEDTASGFNGVRFIAVSPDGRNAYTTSADAAIGIFARNRRSGGLRYEGCITGRIGRGSSAQSGACTPIPTATPVARGIHSGIGDPTSLVFSPDGRYLYVAARGDAGVATFLRRRDGSLAFHGCLTAGISGFVAGFSTACTPIADAAGTPTATVLRAIGSIAISPDGTSVYATSPRKAAIAVFARDPIGGGIAYRGCISGEHGRPGTAGMTCTPIPTAGEIPADSGMWGIDRLAISRDGRWLYGAARTDNTIVRFSRDPAGGALVYAGCITADRELGSFRDAPNPCAAPARDNRPGAALGRPADLLLSRDGRSLYVAAAGSSAIVRLARDPAGGALSFSTCLTANPAVARPAGPCKLARAPRGRHQLGFAGLNSLAFARGGLYATAGGQSAVTRFAPGN